MYRTFCLDLRKYNLSYSEFKKILFEASKIKRFQRFLETFLKENIIFQLVFFKLNKIYGIRMRINEIKAMQNVDGVL